MALACCAGAVLVALWSAVCATPRLDWNAARLMPAFLLAAGEKIYFAPGEGPALGWIYGPVMPVVMMPATLWPSLTSAMVAAGCINAALLLAPLLVGANAVAKRVGLAGLERGWVLVACAGGALAVPWLAGGLIYISADNTAVGLSLWSCVGLAHASDNGRRAWFAAALAALAVWTKQIAIGVPVAQLLWLAWVSGAGATARYAGRLLVAGVALAAICVAIFGWAELRYNLWTVPSNHPLKGGAGFWLSQFGKHSLGCLPWVAALVVLRWRATTLCRASSLIAVLAFVQLPLGALGASKVGGGENSFHSIYYFVAAVLLQLAAASGALAPLRRRIALFGAAATLAGLFGVVGFAGWRLTPAVQLEASCEFAVAQRGKVLFPRNPLVTWWTERKVYHLEYGFLDQALAGKPATPARFAAWLPARLRYIVYQDDDFDHVFARLLPGFEQTMSLPGFVIHVAAGTPDGGK